MMGKIPGIDRCLVYRAFFICRCLGKTMQLIEKSFDICVHSLQHSQSRHNPRFLPAGLNTVHVSQMKTHVPGKGFLGYAAFALGIQQKRPEKTAVFRRQGCRKRKKRVDVILNISSRQRGIFQNPSLADGTFRKKVADIRPGCRHQSRSRAGRDITFPLEMSA